MAYDAQLQVLPGGVAGEDLSSYQYHFCKLHTTSGKVIKCASQGEACVGVLQDKPNADGKACALAYGGVTRVMAGDTIAPGQWLTPGADAQAEVAATGDYVCGIALEGGADNQIITALLFPGGYIVP